MFYWLFVFCIFVGREPTPVMQRVAQRGPSPTLGQYITRSIARRESQKSLLENRSSVVMKLTQALTRFFSYFRFPNIGQTCYLNSSLQSLLTLKDFFASIRSTEPIWGSVPAAQLLRYNSHVTLMFHLKPWKPNEQTFLNSKNCAVFAFQAAVLDKRYARIPSCNGQTPPRAQV